MDDRSPDEELPWEIQDSEPAHYFDVFRRYLLGGNEDVKAAVAEWYESRGETAPRKVELRFYKASQKWSWKARSREYWKRAREVEDREIAAERRREQRANVRRCRRLLERIDKAEALIPENSELLSLWIQSDPKAVAQTIAALRAEIREDLFDTADDRKARDEAIPRGNSSLPDLDARLVTPKT